MSGYSLRARRIRYKALKEMLRLQRLHVVEVGRNNRGPMVDRIIDYARGALGEAWCVDTMIWVYGHAGSRFLKPGFSRAVAYMNAHGVRPIALAKLHAGDVLRYVFDHTEMFVGWRRLVYVRGRAVFVRCPRRLATHVKAVGGNTGADGAVSDGAGSDGVHVRYRPIGLIADALRVYG